MYYNSKIIFAKMLSEDSGVTLRDSDDDKVRLTHNGTRTTIHMPVLDASITDDDPRSVWWWGTFCSLLDRLTGVAKVMEADAASMYSTNTPFGRVINQVLATNATNLGLGKYEGKDDWVLDSMDQDGVLFEQSLKDDPPNMSDKNEACDINTILFDQMCKTVRHGTYTPEYAGSVAKMRELAEDESLVKSYLSKKTDLQQAIHTTKALLKHFDLDPEEEEEKAKEAKKKEGEGKAGEGEGEEGEGRVGPSTVKFSDINQDDGGSGKPNGDMTIEYEESDLYDSDTYIPKDVTVKHMDSSSNKPNPYLSDKLTKQVANLLKVRSQVRWKGGKRSGRIRSRSLARAGSDEHYDTPFKKKEDNNVLDTCVTLLVDTSGSMSGNRYKLAVESANKLCETLTGVHIPVSVIGFTQVSGKNHMLIHKDFHDKYDGGKLYNNLQEGEHYMGSNDDGVSLDWCHTQIHKQKQKRKIIIVLSDGQPSCGYIRGNPAAYLRLVSKEVEKDTDVYAIGIQTDSVKLFYTHSKVLDRVEDLEKTVINVIKDKVI